MKSNNHSRQTKPITTKVEIGERTRTSFVGDKTADTHNKIISIQEIDEMISATNLNDYNLSRLGAYKEGFGKCAKEWKSDKLAMIEAIDKEIQYCSNDECVCDVLIRLKKQIGGGK